ncbi:MAG TPA: hypothetical protein VHX61_14030 [Rhizomicrobium sp.]|nr:hypothetical protein [Rhizomicrobium sp.]
MLSLPLKVFSGYELTGLDGDIAAREADGGVSLVMPICLMTA